MARYTIIFKLLTGLDVHKDANTIEEIAKIINMSRCSVYRIMNGKAPRKDIEIKRNTDIKKGRLKRLTDEQRKQNLKESQKKYMQRKKKVKTLVEKFENIN